MAVIKTHRAALDSAGLQGKGLIVGTGTSSTWESIELTQEAADAGANYAMVIPPGYFKSAMTDASLEKFFTDVCSYSVCVWSANLSVQFNRLQTPPLFQSYCTTSPV